MIHFSLKNTNTYFIKPLCLFSNCLWCCFNFYCPSLNKFHTHSPERNCTYSLITRDILVHMSYVQLYVHMYIHAYIRTYILIYTQHFMFYLYSQSPKQFNISLKKEMSIFYCLNQISYCT